MLGVIRMILVGLVVGILARFFYPGRVEMTVLMTIILGIARVVPGRADRLSAAPPYR